MPRLTVFLVLLSLISLASCSNEDGKFVLLDSQRTNITFNNDIREDDTINIFDFSNIYNGGGIAAGDFDNDGKTDLYFTGNMVSNKLYLNKGDFRFEDVTTVSGTEGRGRWSRGVATVDINTDGKLDIYVCATAYHDPMRRINMLYVNQGNDKNGVPVFKDLASEYGLADTTHSTMAYFFDYDNDDDLDLYIGVNHIIVDEYTNLFKKRNINGEHPSTGKLYRNDWSDSLAHPVFTDVSRTAGILIEGYTHAVNITDFNQDGWLDIFVANDYISSNVLYINNHDGTFTDRVTEYFKHAAANSMGSDAVDINNDGWLDIIEVDMAPQDNLRKKMFQNPISYQTYQNTEQFGYQYQYPRNMVQVNMGPAVGENDSLLHPIFGDAGFFAGIAETDWSWTPLVADFDNDGLKDVIFTNGFPKDITDHDFRVFRQEAYSLTPKSEMLAEIPEVKIHNYAYRNTGDLSFTDVSTKWGLEKPSFSNGAIYADLDGDGDLDMVVNNIDDEAMVYENRINAVPGKRTHALRIDFKGTKQNPFGFGARVQLFTDSVVQTYEQYPYRGYLSSQPMTMHIGTGQHTTVDSLIVYWPGQKKQVLKNVATDKPIVVDVQQAVSYVKPMVPQTNWFVDVTKAAGIDYVHQQRDFIDFNIQKLLPHKFSEYTPGIAAGDVNGDGLDDFIVGGSNGYPALIFQQQTGGTFTRKPLTDVISANREDRGLVLFDADNDGDLDLYAAAGGYQWAKGNVAYDDRFFVNDGKGNFRPDSLAIPRNTTSKFCVRTADIDRDGDLDLFIAGRVDPHSWPKPVSSFIYRNDSRGGTIRFTDISRSAAPELFNMGLACDAVFSDYDNDGWPDLVIAGEWMPIRFFHNEKGKFRETTQTGIENYKGWWNSLAPGDFDNDGDIDYIAGNLGLNSFFKATTDRPVKVYAKDFDNNGSYDAITTLSLLSGLQPTANWYEYPAHGRDDMVKQILGTRRDFQNYKSYAMATIDQLLAQEKRKDALQLSANHMGSSYIRNDGGGKFTIHALPAMAQLSLINGMVADDFDGDGNLDVAMNTNDFGTDPTIGRYDALNGLVLKGDGKGGFTPLTMQQSGICISGNGKALAKLRIGDTGYAMIASQNRGPLKLYRNKKTNQLMRISPGDQAAVIDLGNGRKQRVELHTGSSFLSQSSRFITLPSKYVSVQIIRADGTVTAGTVASTQ